MSFLSTIPIRSSTGCYLSHGKAYIIFDTPRRLYGEDKMMGCNDPTRLELLSREHRIKEIGRKELNEDFKIEQICELISTRSRGK
jgi:hypothetical protein